MQRNKTNIPKNNYLLEVGTEEIPARFMNSALIQMKSLFEQHFKENNIDFENISVYGTMRRFVIYVKGVPERRKIIEKEIMGPPEHISFRNGKPTESLEKFLKSKGAKIKDVKITETKKGRYVAVKVREGGDKIIPFLSEISAECIQKISFPKNMRWDSGGIKFARPIRWILSLYGNTSVPVSLGTVKSGNFSRGHRQTGGKIRIRKTEEYFKKIKEAGVICSFEERLRKIQRQIQKVEKKENAKALLSRGDIEELSWMVENPYGVLCNFSENFLSLPRELIESILRKGLKAVTFVNKRGKILPFALFFADACEGKIMRKNVKRGAEKVIQARLEDGEFYFKDDLKQDIHFFVEQLKGIKFGEGLGSMYERCERIKGLLKTGFSGILYPDEIEETSKLMDFDLTTSVVSEFPELHGYIGRIYAEKKGIKNTVARAIEEHIYPRFSGDKLPESPQGIALSICDRIDSICGHFKVGHKPTGDADPYGVRRDAIGIAEIVWQRVPDFDIKELVEEAAKSFLLSDDEVQEIIAFLFQRILGVLSSKVGRQFAESAFIEPYNPVLIMKRIKAIKKLKKMNKLSSLSTLHKRFRNIVKSDCGIDIEADILKEDAEKAFYEKLIFVEKNVEEQLKTNMIEDAMKELLSLEKLAERFFNEVFVMVEDENLRNNRLSLLNRAKNLFSKVGDFSRL